MRTIIDSEVLQSEQMLKSFSKISDTITNSEELNDVFRNALNEITKLKFYKPGCAVKIFLLSKDSDDLVMADNLGVFSECGCSDKPVKIGECLCGIAAGHGHTIISNDCRNDKRYIWNTQHKFPHKDICIPLMSREKTLGVVNISMPSKQVIDKTDYRLLNFICKQLSCAVYNAQLIQDVEHYRKKIKSLSIQLKEAKEAERKKLARELHDRVGSNLTALGINLKMLKMQQNRSIDQNLECRIDETIGIVKQTSRLIRDIVRQLRTSTDNPDLFNMIRKYSEKYTEWTNIPVEIISDDDLPRISRSERLELFCIVQEALSNIAKYSKATIAKVEIVKDRDKIRISITDNGVGFNPLLLKDKVKQGHFGIAGMIERAKNMNGMLSVSSNAGKGTNIKIEIRQ